MTYFAFLALFLGIPLVILSVITIVDYRRGRWLPSALSARRAWVVIIGLCVVAFVYTTPWDNYLVATRVWWYDPALVTGIVIGYVPIEEYTFFIVLPIFASLLALWLIRLLPTPAERVDAQANTKIRIASTLLVTVIWLISVMVLVLTFLNEAYAEWTYLALLLSWALIPIGIQFAFGADILLRHWRVVSLTILFATLYLSATDAVAIQAGTWTINPEQSLPVYLAGVLPIEEGIFFLLVSTLSVFGLVLVLAEESQVRALSLERYALMRPLIQLIKEKNNVSTLTEVRS